MRRFFLGFALLLGCHTSPPPAPPAPKPGATQAPAPVAVPTPPACTDVACVKLTVQGGERHFLGENVLVDYCVENPRNETLDLELGGDYRFGRRHHRFKLSLTDAQGNAMPDPDPEEYDAGGLVWNSTLRAKGNAICQSLQLPAYRRYDRAGTYTIRVTHALGLPPGAAPTGETKVTFVDPSPEEAETVLAKAEALPKSDGISAGQTTPPYLDYWVARHPPYLPALERRAKTGNADAINGIGQIPNQDATRALIALLDDPHPDVAKNAALTLGLRLPDPQLQGKLGHRNPFDNELTAERKYLISVGWSPAFVAPVRAAARKLLAKDDDDAAKSGAFFLEAVGTPDDNAIVLDAFTRALQRSVTTPRERDLLPTPRGACMELGRATTMLLARGAAPPDPPKTLGEVGEALLAKPKDVALLHTALTHPNFHLRRMALEQIGRQDDPVPLGPQLFADIGANLGSSDLDVLYAASAVVETRNLVTLGPKTAAIVGKVTNEWILRAAWNAATQVHARAAAAEALVPRLTEPEFGTEALRRLIDLFANNGLASSDTLSPAQAKALVPIWKKVVAEHRSELTQGKELSLDDPSIPKTLVPEGWAITREGKASWPQ